MNTPSCDGAAACTPTDVRASAPCMSQKRKRGWIADGRRSGAAHGDSTNARTPEAPDRAHGVFVHQRTHIKRESVSISTLGVCDAVVAAERVHEMLNSSGSGMLAAGRDARRKRPRTPEQSHFTDGVTPLPRRCERVRRVVARDSHSRSIIQPSLTPELRYARQRH